MKNYTFLLLITLSFISCGKNEETTKNSELPFFNTALFTPEWISKKSSNYKNIHTIPEFSFVNQDGNLVTNETYKGKMYVADFFFVSCPGICPKLTKNMSILQEEFNDDSNVLLLSHTVMPESDSVPVLKEYALHNDINSKKWSLVTGDNDEIYAIARAGYFADEDFVNNHDLCVVGTSSDRVFEIVKEVHGNHPKEIVKVSETEAELLAKKEKLHV